MEIRRKIYLKSGGEPFITQWTKVPDEAALELSNATLREVLGERDYSIEFIIEEPNGQVFQLNIACDNINCILTQSRGELDG